MSDPTKQHKWKARWVALWQKPHSRWLLGIPVGGYLAFLFGVIFWGGFNTSIALSNTEEFCISCHEMEAFVYQEYKETIHYSNRTGVRAICTDCHVPKSWGYKVLRKIKATTKEVPHWILGSIDTREKFEAKRLTLAQEVWAEMQGNDSRECRNCHELQHMDLEKQGRTASRKHTLERQTERGETCIDCHKGIAHHLPEGYED